MITEKTIAKIKTNLFHGIGGFIVGASFYFLLEIKNSEGFNVGINFAMFLVLLLLGLSYLGE